jgi:hypothetical protein
MAEHATDKKAIAKADGGKKRHRSPNYPAIGLRSAVEKVTALYRQDGKPGAPLEAALKHFGYSSGHGQAMGVVSAIKKFGLIEDRNGRIVPTPLAVNIIEFDDTHARHREALREAALKPEIYAGLVEQYREHGRLPSDDSLRPELVTDMAFNPKAVNGFLSDFRDTLNYAGLLDGNTLKLSGVSEEEGEEREDEDVMTANSGILKNPELPPPPGGHGGAKEHPKPPLTGPSVQFDLPRGNAIEIRLRSKVTPEEFRKIKQIFELSEMAFIEDATGDVDRHGLRHTDAAEVAKKRKAMHDADGETED